jgi:hypothetical protein
MVPYHRSLLELGELMEIDLRTLTKLILKLLGVYMLVMLMISVPLFYFTESVPTYLQITNIIYGVVMLLVSVGLIWSPGAISNGILRFKGENFAPAAKAHSGFRVGVALLGLYYVIAAIRGIGYLLVEMKFGPYVVGNQQMISLSGWSFQLVLGAVCLARPGLVEQLANLGPYLSRNDPVAEGSDIEGGSTSRQLEG